MDNRIFNVNGEGKKNLLLTLQLAFSIDRAKKIKGWTVNPEKGLILHSYGEGINNFITDATPEGIIDTVWDWLTTDEAKKIPHKNGWDEDHQHDGSNGPGWRVYVEDWGHVGDKWGCICCIKPAFMWYGK